MTFLTRMVSLGLIVMLVAACGSLSDPTPAPDPTRTPLSTALPEIATIVPAGEPQNPLQLYVVPPQPAAANALETQLEDAILEATDGQIAVDIRIVESEAAAVDAVCTVQGGIVSAAWVDGVTYRAINAQGCGNAQLQQQRGDSTGEAGVILLNRALGNAGTAVVEGRTFCRLSRDSFYSWLLPVLMLRAGGVQIDEIGAIRDYASYDDLLTATANGDCAASGMPQSVWDAYEAEEENDERVGEVFVGDTSVEMPYGILAMSFETPGTTRRLLTNALLEFDAPEVTVEVTELSPPTATPTAEVTLEVTEAATSEATAEATGEATSEATTDATAEATTEVTAEATIESTEEVTPESTADASAESTPDADTVSLLVPFFGEGEFITVESGDFDALESFLDETGLNLDQLGQ